MTWLVDGDGQDDFTPWSLADIYNDLGGRGDIARVLNVSHHRVTNWLERRDRIGCPHPVRRIGPTDIYSMQEWKTWFAAWTDPSRKGRRKDSKWVDTKIHGEGENFFTYGRKADDA